MRPVTMITGEQSGDTNNSPDSTTLIGSYVGV